MSNALGTLFGDIAAAIREKNGETGTMKPAEFPEKISAIETGGGSVAGGNIAAGVYWEATFDSFPNDYHQTWHRINGNLYAITLEYEGAGGDLSLYQNVDGTWTLLNDSFCSGSGSSSGWCIVEYNDKLHILSVGFDTHYVWDVDNNALVQYRSLPTKMDARACVVHNGSLKYYGMGTGSIYVWDEETDTWAVEAKISSNTYTSYTMFVANDELYLNNSKVLYKYADGALTRVFTLSASISGRIVAYGGKMYHYYFSQNSRIKTYRLYELDLDAQTDTLIGYVPYVNTIYMFELDGNINILTGGNSGYNRLIMHRVESAG